MLAGSPPNGHCSPYSQVHPVPEGSNDASIQTYVLVAFAPAKSENSGIVADEGYALARVGRPTAEVACFDPVWVDNMSVFLSLQSSKQS